MKIVVKAERDMENCPIVSPFIWISIASPRRSPFELPVPKACMGRMFMCFDDLDHMPSADKICLGVSKPYMLFNDAMARNVWDFVKKFPDVDILICQCEAGISRSAGMAAGLSKIINGTDDMYFDKYIPNRLVYRKILTNIPS